MVKILFLFAFLLGAWSSAWAHPPAAVDLNYDGMRRRVTVTVIHPVSNPQTHYIFKVTLFLNGQAVAEQNLDRQSSVEDEKIVFDLAKGLQAGDVLIAQAFCNLSGQKAVFWKLK